IWKKTRYSDIAAGVLRGLSYPGPGSQLCAPFYRPGAVRYNRSQLYRGQRLYRRHQYRRIPGEESRFDRRSVRAGSCAGSRVGRISGQLGSSGSLLWWGGTLFSQFYLRVFCASRIAEGGEPAGFRLEEGKSGWLPEILGYSQNLIGSCAVIRVYLSGCSRGAEQLELLYHVRI